MKNFFLFSLALAFSFSLISCKGSKEAGYSVRYTDHGATAPSPGQEKKYGPSTDQSGDVEPASDKEGKD